MNGTPMNLKEPSETLIKGRSVLVLNDKRRTKRFHNPKNLGTRKPSLGEIHDHSKLSAPMGIQNV